MKRMRQIKDEWTEDDVQFLSRYGVKVKPKPGRYTEFHIEEGEAYLEIRKHFEKRWKPLLCHDFPYYEYSREELEDTDYFLLWGCHCCGYPQPESDFRYKSVSFDASKICPECGCGRIQTNDLRVNKLSKHGFWGFFAWLYDEFFVSAEIYDEVFAPHGIKKRTVIKGGKVLEDVFQLVIPVIDEPLDLSERPFLTCPVCGETKHTMLHNEYPFFPLHDHPLPGIYKTKEYFGGSGHQAQRQIILSKDVAKKLIESKNMCFDGLIPCRRGVK